MKNIREYAAQVEHEIVGKLTRHPEFESNGYRHYSDEAGNEYIIRKNEICIVTSDGGVI